MKGFGSSYKYYPAAIRIAFSLKLIVDTKAKIVFFERYHIWIFLPTELP